MLNLLYNEANRVAQIKDAGGAAAIFNFDSEQRLTRQLLPNGDEKTFEYNENGKLKAITNNGERTEIARNEASLTESRTRKNGKSAKSIFNRRGQEIRLQIENGVAVDFEYDEKGRKVAEVYSDTGRFEKTFDAAGRKTSEKMPSGLIQNYEYNADNQLVRQSGNRGRSARVERDASGNITKLVNQNTEVQVLRDDAGRIVQLTNSRGQSRRYVYNSRGSLTRFIGADGRDLQFQYSERGEMQSIINAQTDSLIYQRNGRGSLAKIQQQPVNRKNIWQMQKINYTSSFTNAAVADSCAFGDNFDMGGDSGWMSSWGGSGSIFANIEVSGDGGNCYDPFGSSGGGGGESCSQCRTRETNSCNNIYRASLQSNTGWLLIGTGGCIVIGVYTAVVGGLICQTGVSGGTVLQNDAARQVRDDCLNNVSSKCESKCN